MKTALLLFCSVLMGNPVFAQDDLRERCRREAGFDEKGNWGDSSKVRKEAVEVCRAAVAAYPNVPELWAYLGRTLYLHGQPDESRKWIERAASRTVVGTALMGVVNDQGYGGPKNEAEAVRWYRKAAEQGSAPAQYNSGSMYDNGRGVEKDEAEAVRWYRKAADQGYANAQSSLGSMYDNGRGVEKDEAEAVRWYRKAADQGYANAQSSLGWMYDNGRGVEKDETEAVRWYRKAADQGYANAQSSLGWMYDNGRGVEKDEAEAVRWYRKAADQGYANAQSSLGWMYDNGRGVEKDETEAVRWYRKAADQGYANAQSNLGWMYENGQGVEKDETEAVRWYRKAADQGYANAQNNLGTMYANGQGVEKDETEAVRWHRKAADQGYANAQNNLGSMYANGQGVEKDETEAVRWYRKAADQGYANAQNNLGTMYANGQGVEKDEVEAARWYRKEAEQGDANGQINLAVMYASGRGVERNREEAARLFEAAARKAPVETLSVAVKFDSPSRALERFTQLGRSRPIEAAAAKIRYLADAHLFGASVRLAVEFLQSSGYAAASQAERKLFDAALDKTIRELCNPTWSGEQDISMLRALADLGVRDAALQLGEAYANGLGVEKDDKAALVWFRKAAEFGSPVAQNALGMMYEQGRGVTKDYIEAMYWFALAAQHGGVQAQRNLGVMYENGRGVEKDEAEAVRWYRKAVDRGHASAQSNLGNMYLDGRGVQKDDVKAVALYRQSAVQGYSSAQFGLGWMYANGRGVEKDEGEAVRWYRKAADQGNARAQFYLGLSYEYGDGVVKDDVEALRWYHKAADQGHAASKLAALGFSSGLSEKLSDGVIEKAGTKKETARPGVSDTAAVENDLRLPASTVPAVSHATLVSISTSDDVALVRQQLEERIARLKNEIEERSRSGKITNVVERYREIADVEFLLGRTDAAVTARIMAAQYESMEREVYWGSTENYFYLLESSCYWSRETHWAHEAGRPDVALYLAKRSVNILQQARRQLGTLSPEIRECFLKVHEDRYRWLADLFIEMGRLPEAEHVIGMLRSFEADEYIRGPGSGAEVNLPVTETDRALDNLVEEPAAFVRLSVEREALLRLQGTRTLTTDESARLEYIANEFMSADQQARETLSRIQAEVAKLDRRGEVQTAARNLDTLSSIRPVLRDVFKGRAAVVHTVVLPDRTHILVTTAELPQFAYTVSISSADLARKVQALRTAVGPSEAASGNERSRLTTDPRPVAKELYELLIEPIEKTLTAAKVDTVMFSMDKVLQYLPIAALYDGKQYLVERYAISTYTDPTSHLLTLANAPRWRVAAFGTSAAYPPKFGKLQYVEGEISSIVHVSAKDQGVLEGTKKLNQEFTKKSFATALASNYPLVHVASHFNLQPGEPKDSFLLLGDGNPLSLDEIAKRFSFDHVDLLTLSACETAVGTIDSNSAGQEVQGFAVLAQNRGAKAVLATLWKVNDMATARFMKRFYQFLSRSPGVNKAQALRQVQIEFIHSGGNGNSGSSLSPGGSQTSQKGTSQPGDTHPFFWAPFVLMGNWR